MNVNYYLRKTSSTSKESFETEPELFLVYYQSGLRLMESGELDEAIAAFQHSIELNPGFIEGFANLGNAKSKQWKIDEAIAAFNKTIELNSEFSHGYVGLGFSFLIKGQYNEADLAFKKAIDLEPNLYTAFEGLGRSLTEQERFNEAIDCLCKAVELNPASSEVFIYLGLSFLHQGDLDKASTAFQQAAKLDPQSLQIKKRLGIIQWLSEERSNIPNVEIISVHIPKTAGNTFQHCFLEKIYASDQIFYDYDSLCLEDTLLQMKPQTKVIHGHFSALKYKGIFPSARLVTWLRHPFSQRISWYYFWLTLPKSKDERHIAMLENNLSFKDFINLPYTHNNFSSYYLRGVELEEFDFIGLQEFFEEDLGALATLAGYKDFQSNSVKINQNSYADYESFKQKIIQDPELIELMSKNNSKDLKLYQFALELRNHRRNR